MKNLPGDCQDFKAILIEQYNKTKQNTQAVKALLAMAVGNPAPERLTQLIGEFYTTPGHAIFIAADGDSVTGIIGVDFTLKPHGLITHIAVRPDIRMRGIGKKLINHVIETMELTSIELETDQDAVEFYRACGFEIREIESRWPGVHRYRCTKDTS